MNIPGGEFFEIHPAGDVVIPDNGGNLFELVIQSTEAYNANSGYTQFDLLDSSYRRVFHISLRGNRFVLNTSLNGYQWDEEEVHYFSTFLGNDYSFSGFTIRSTQDSYYILFGEHRGIEFKKRSGYTDPVLVVAYSHSYGISGFPDSLRIKYIRSSDC